MKKAVLTGSDTIGKCSLLLVKISATALLGSVVFYGAIVVGKVIQPLEKPTQRVAVVAANLGLIGIAGLVVSSGLYLCGREAVHTGSKDEDECRLELEELKRQLEIERQRTLMVHAAASCESSRYQVKIEAQDNEIFRRGRELREVRQQLRISEQQLIKWDEWWKLASSLDEKYDIVGCKGCKYFVGESMGEENINFFACAMHPYGKRCCEDRE